MPSEIVLPGPVPLLQGRGLTVRYGESECAPALNGIDFEIAPGEIVGILGESGSGKSTLALSILGLLPAQTSVSGSMTFRSRQQESPQAQNENLLRLDESRWKAIRGARISMIFQEPGLSLSPVMRVGDQIAEVIRAHRPGGRKLRREECEEMLKEVQLFDVDRICKAYPHQLSGGELHRVAIAQALACRPELVIADEPTRALDVTVEAEVLELLRDVNRKFGSALIFITHNPALLAGFADRVMVMYAGRVVEEGPAPLVLRRPLHPYTNGLLQLAPRSFQASGLDKRERLQAIPGSLSNSHHLIRGCTFEPRCSARTTECQSEYPHEVIAETSRRVSCFNYGN